jgi:hypothetical protein
MTKIGKRNLELYVEPEKSNSSAVVSRSASTGRFIRGLSEARKVIEANRRLVEKECGADAK